MPDEVGAELDAVQVVGVLALVVEHHLLQLVPVLSCLTDDQDAVVDGDDDEQGDDDDDEQEEECGDEEITDDPLHVVVEAVCLVPAVALVWGAHLPS